ncbi:MAG TPA: TAXI family TRAP transporter solute-binding subunit [Burkholderiales bacterium]
MKRLLFLVALAASGAAFAQQVSIGTSPQGTAGYSMGAALAKLMAEKTVYQARVQPFTGNSIALAGINQGELDFTVANEVEIVEALKGAGSYQGRKQDNVRLATVLYPFTVAILVKKDSPMQTIADLKGKRMTWGYTAQVTLKSVVSAMLANAGLGEADIQPVLVPNVVRGADDFAGGKADAFFFALGAAKVTETDASVGGLRALPMSDAPEAVARMKKVLPEGYVFEVKPRPGLAGVAAPTKVLAYDYVLVAGKHVKDAVVFALLEAMANNKPLLAASFAGFNGFDPARMSKRVEAEYHDGAEKFLIKAGQWPPR